MKKSELKNIIKECVKEVIFEDGVLSGLITEVAKGLQTTAVVQENRMTKIVEASKVRKATDQDKTKKAIMSAINRDYEDVKSKFSNPSLFEGTKPIPNSDGKGALSGIAPGDSGVDLSSIPGMGNWAAIAEGNRK